MNPSRRLSRQRGASLISLLVLAVIVGFFMLLAINTFPSVNEYLTIRKGLGSIMRKGPASESEIRGAFGKLTEVEYSIKTISAKDLVIKPIGDTGGFRVSFAYNVEIPIIDPVFLLVKYAGTSTSGGAKGP
jgi:hypothetical protein